MGRLGDGGVCVLPTLRKFPRAAFLASVESSRVLPASRTRFYCAEVVCIFDIVLPRSFCAITVSL